MNKVEWTEATWNPSTGYAKSAMAAKIAMPKLQPVQIPSTR